MVSLNTNVAAMMTQRHLSQAADQNVESQRNLSSGYRINSASDDAAGLQISNTLHVQTRGIDVALRNAHDAYSVAQTAEGALHESSDILQRLRSIGLQAANGSHEQDDRTSLQQEVIALQDELIVWQSRRHSRIKTSSMALMVLRVFILAPMRTLYH